MFDKIFSLFLPECKFLKMAEFTNDVAQLLSHFEEEYLKDKSSKNAAIDTICEILQSHKDK
jgi:hypothetical protein